MRTMSGALPRGGMKSITRTRPVDVCHSLSRISVFVAVAALGRRAALAARCSQRPCSRVPSSAPKQELESKRGKQSQSTEPVAADERRGLQVADECVVLDPLGH